MPDPRPAIGVEIWSDVACPWCYIAKHRFETIRREASPRPVAKRNRSVGADGPTLRQ
ncbi:MAG: hypothetical protein EOS41_24785 [Mesorhizobium sp.]|nr:MAG: hypothetical protein EOS41_24785 [Mesorhizobium sp.]